MTVVLLSTAEMAPWSLPRRAETLSFHGPGPGRLTVAASSSLFADCSRVARKISGLRRRSGQVELSRPAPSGGCHKSAGAPSHLPSLPELYDCIGKQAENDKEDREKNFELEN